MGWLAWAFQLALGVVVGLLPATVISRALFRSGFIGADHRLLACLGVALCCGAFASYHGDRTWLGISFFNSPPFQVSRDARVWSIRLGIVGLLLVFLPAVNRILVDGWPTRQVSDPGSLMWSVFIGLIPACLLLHALKTGSFLMNRKIVDREDRPLFFWIYVAVMTSALIGLIFQR